MNYKISDKWTFWAFILGLVGSLISIVWIGYNFYKDFKNKRLTAQKTGLGKAMNTII